MSFTLQAAGHRANQGSLRVALQRSRKLGWSSSLQSYGEAKFRLQKSEGSVKRTSGAAAGEEHPAVRIRSRHERVSVSFPQQRCRSPTAFLAHTGFSSCSFYTLQQQSALCSEYASHALAHQGIKKRALGPDGWCLIPCVI
jgi:hypothetical protein